ncbi:MAG: hypothetical protein P8Y78_14970 [Acidihalobacter sp.]
MSAIEAVTGRYARRLAVIAGAMCFLLASTLSMAAYRDGQLGALNMSDGYVSLSGDSHEYPLSPEFLGRLWREKQSGELGLKPGMRIRLDLKRQPTGSGRGNSVVVDIAPLRGGAK